MLYLQGFLDLPGIVAVAWTLCLEVHFYLVVVLAMLAFGRVGAPGRASSHTSAVKGACLTLGVASLAVPWLGVNAGPWFIASWSMFVLGLVVAWVVVGDLAGQLGWLVLGVTAVWCLAVDRRAASPGLDLGWAAIATAGLLLLLHGSGRLTRTAPPILLKAGFISYSLYLVHLVVIDVVMAGLFKLTRASVVAAWASLVVGGGWSVIAAVLLNRLVERRSISWAQRLKPAGLVQSAPRAPLP